MTGLVYYSSRSGNTARLVERLGLPAARVPISPADPMPVVDKPFVLVCPTFADGEGRGAVPKQVIRLLNDPATRALLRGVIAGGNRNFGTTFALAGDVISKKCGVPVLYRFELAGTDTDVTRIRSGLDRMRDTLCSAA
ncbi:class Ib ribonucleoside-diphosphate reductase assembly flavoprotein NrdI [Psychromarinibacter halotolerans]|uniref:Protein NrdI n=1 Tax=Psychromarinibacter halotolerans TaxID=1775175 RepID=A0ABV7GJX8_9RHOB|nr:class Ib ribonucleoside-diphosphate reductase assembly flavoprotein NrdI [Psychromarinibacter halotolerans]MDF0595655.1 class Ib ribonucleoside-diphosphate reductase assembly flavoprotein NrdI [Psychromarinibacter halotolerans]